MTSQLDAISTNTKATEVTKGTNERQLRTLTRFKPPARPIKDPDRSISRKDLTRKEQITPITTGTGNTIVSGSVCNEIALSAPSPESSLDTVTVSSNMNALIEGEDQQSSLLLPVKAELCEDTSVGAMSSCSLFHDVPEGAVCIPCRIGFVVTWNRACHV